MNSKRIARYWKAIVAGTGAAVIIGNSVVGAAVEGYGDGVWDTQDTLTTVLALLTAVGVYAKANAPAAEAQRGA